MVFFWCFQGFWPNRNEEVEIRKLSSIFVVYIYTQRVTFAHVQRVHLGLTYHALSMHGHSMRSGRSGTRWTNILSNHNNIIM